jgi:RNA polymerase sigma-32 factor
MADKGADPEDLVADYEVQSQISDAIKSFGDQIENERERAIWFERMIAEDNKSLVELGDDWGVSKERIRQVEVQIRERFRKFLLRELGDDVRINFLEMT